MNFFKKWFSKKVEKIEKEYEEVIITEMELFKFIKVDFSKVNCNLIDALWADKIKISLRQLAMEKLGKTEHGEYDPSVMMTKYDVIKCPDCSYKVIIFN